MSKPLSFLQSARSSDAAEKRRDGIKSLIPALSGVVGKIALVAAFASAWATALGIQNPAFVRENVRLELILASVLTLVVTVALRVPAGPPGTLAPLIVLVPAMAAAGVHPLPFGLLAGAAGLLTALLGWQDHLMRINGPGTRGGILVLFSLMGFHNGLSGLHRWAVSVNGILPVLLLLGTGVFWSILLKRFHVRWLTIPVCAATALLLASVFGRFPEWSTGVGLPIVDPARWWQELWGIGWGMEWQGFVRAAPYVCLVLVLWPIDALAVQAILQRDGGDAGAGPTIDFRKTAYLVAVRNLAGVLLGGAQTAAVWRSFMIPLGVVRGPLRRSALWLGLFGILAGLSGVLIDLAVFPPLLWMVLLFGIYLPLLEAGLATLRTGSGRVTAGVCTVAGLAVHPVVGWFISLLLEKWLTRRRQASLPEPLVPESD